MQKYAVMLLILLMSLSKQALSKSNCGDFWPKFKDPKQIEAIFDPNWTRMQIMEKKIGTKWLYFNIVGFKSELEFKISHTVDAIKEKVKHDQLKEDLALVPYQLERTGRPETEGKICQYRLIARPHNEEKETKKAVKNVCKSIIKIGRVEHESDQLDFTNIALTIQEVDLFLSNLNRAMPYFMPAIVGTLQTIAKSVVLIKEGINAEEFGNTIQDLTETGQSAVENIGEFLEKITGSDLPPPEPSHLEPDDPVSNEHKNIPAHSSLSGVETAVPIVIVGSQDD